MFRLLIILLLLATSSELFAQRDTMRMVEILPGAERLYIRRLPNNTEIQILAGNVRLRQGNTLFFTDSCVVNSAASLFEAFGSVHINDSDTANVWSDYLRYHTNTRKAFLTGNVRLSDGHATLNTTRLEYDVNTRIGVYTNGGRVVNKSSVLTSREGTYYADIHDIFFRNNVELNDPAYYLRTEALLYNTETQMARFVTDTYIRDSSNRVIRTSEGFYDVANRRAEFTSRTIIEDGALIVTADEISSDDQQGTIQLLYNAVVRDTAQGVDILAHNIFVNRNNDAVLATVQPLMIIRQEEDSIFIAADTLFTARLTDLFTGLDTLFSSEKDSNNRYFEAYRNVRVYSDSLQSVSDSLFYSFYDSTFHMFYDPVVWNKQNQITGDSIYLYTKNKKADRIRVIENSFMVSEVEQGVYNQISSTRMDGLFTDGTIDSVRARGLAESIYYIQDNDSAYTSVNKTTSDIIDIYFSEGELSRVVLRSSVEGTLFPISQVDPEQMRLNRFRWLNDRRPRSRYDLMQ